MDDDVLDLERRVTNIESALDELRRAGLLSRPAAPASTPLRTIDQVPKGHKRGHCTECGGFHPVDGVLA